MWTRGVTGVGTVVFCNTHTHLHTLLHLLVVGGGAAHLVCEHTLNGPRPSLDALPLLGFVRRLARLDAALARPPHEHGERAGGELARGA